MVHVFHAYADIRIGEVRAVTFDDVTRVAFVHDLELADDLFSDGWFGVYKDDLFSHDYIGITMPNKRDTPTISLTDLSNMDKFLVL